MGGSTTTTNVVKNNNTTTNSHTTVNNIEKTRQEWNIHNHDDTIIEGKQIQGRTVDISNSGNVGLRCIGMVEGDPRCHMASMQLQEMNFVTDGLHQLGTWAHNDLIAAEHAFQTVGHYVYQGVVYTSKQAYAAALWCWHDQECHDKLVNLGKEFVKDLEEDWSKSHPVTDDTPKMLLIIL